jgi:ankyrin repeat protein
MNRGDPALLSYMTDGGKSARTEAVKLLAAAGCDLNVVDSQGYSPLMLGVRFDFRKAVEFLRRRCECSCDVYLCFLHSAHANLTINMQLYTLQWSETSI